MGSITSGKGFVALLQQTPAPASLLKQGFKPSSDKHAAYRWVGQAESCAAPEFRQHPPYARLQADACLLHACHMPSHTPASHAGLYACCCIQLLQNSYMRQPAYKPAYMYSQAKAGYSMIGSNPKI